MGGTEWDAITHRRKLNELFYGSVPPIEEAAIRVALIRVDLMAEGIDELDVYLNIDRLLSYLNPNWRTDYGFNTQQA